MSADTVSPLFPDRPIRPLPRRRLREKLSPDVADSLQCPSPPQTVAPLFYYPYGIKDGSSEPNGHTSRDRAQEPDSSLGAARNGDQEVDEVGPGIRRGVVHRASPELLGHAIRLQASKTDPGRTPALQQLPSASSLIDGYDSIENTNNKKKRKIPTAGEMSLNGGHSLIDGTGSLSPVLTAASSGAGSNNSTLQGAGGGGGGASGASSTSFYAGSRNGSSTGISGPGRGRYGRTRSGRSPLRSLSDATGNWAGRNSRLRAEQLASQTKSGSPGIISAAIANAEKLPSRGQENVSLLLQHQTTKPTSATTQFTFTCDSQVQVPGKFTWPGSNLDQKSSTLPSNQRQTTLPAQHAPGQAPGKSRMDLDEVGETSSLEAQCGSSGSSRADASFQSFQSDSTPKKSGGSTNSFLGPADRRRERTRLQNLRNPPKEEDIWICEFCEYEMIFGYPPLALIRQYEIKAQRHRHQEEERRRLLEKAKMKGRKGKKASKAPPKNSTVPESNMQNRNPQGAQGGQQERPRNPTSSQGTQTDDYLEYEVDDYGNLSPPPIDEDRSAQAVIGGSGTQTLPSGTHPTGGGVGGSRGGDSGGGGGPGGGA